MFGSGTRWTLARTIRAQSAVTMIAPSIFASSESRWGVNSASRRNPPEQTPSTSGPAPKTSRAPIRAWMIRSMPSRSGVPGATRCRAARRASDRGGAGIWGLVTVLAVGAGGGTVSDAARRRRRPLGHTGAGGRVERGRVRSGHDVGRFASRHRGDAARPSPRRPAARLDVDVVARPAGRGPRGRARPTGTRRATSRPPPTGTGSCTSAIGVPGTVLLPGAADAVAAVRSAAGRAVVDHREVRAERVVVPRAGVGLDVDAVEGWRFGPGEGCRARRARRGAATSGTRRTTWRAPAASARPRSG